MVGFELDESEVVVEAYRRIHDGYDIESLQEIQRQLEGIKRDASPFQRLKIIDAIRDLRIAIQESRRHEVLAHA